MKISQFTHEYRWLSNFHESPVVLDGMTYPTVEHAYQAAKTDSFEMRLMIQECKTPNAARRLGQKVSIRSDWDTYRLEAMRSLLEQKFSKEPLRTMLLETGDAELIEGNWWKDRFWGVCDGVGENNLGKMLMELRARL